MSNIKTTWVWRLALLATLLACVVVVLGAFTRLKDAGLGCPDWPGCYGHLTWPTSAEHIAAADALFPEAPVQRGKSWPEMIHRYFAGSLGLLIVALAAGIWWRRKRTGEPLPRWHATGLVALVVLQAAFGMWTVTLKLWPQVVTAHLLGGFATLSLLWLLVQRLAHWHWQLPEPAFTRLVRLRPLVVTTLLLVIMQVALGGWTSSNYAALACGVDFPTCHNQWWPHMDVARGFNFAQSIGPNYLGGLLDGKARTAIHMAHRLGALLVTLAVLLLALRLWCSKSLAARRLMVLLLTVLALQISLGVTNVLAVLPLLVAVSHNAGAALLLLTLVTLTHRVFTAQHSPINTH